MAGIVDGQAVAATPSNAAWLAKNGNDSTIGILGLNETASATSGPPILNTQAAINVIIDAIGGNQDTPATGYGPLPANTIDGLTHEQALGVIARLFQAATGHNHSGLDGQGPPVAAVTTFGASGSGVAATGAITISEGTGITLNQTGQNVEIAAALSLAEVLSVGNTATAGIDFLGGAIAGLSYLEMLTAGLPPSNPASGHVWVAASADSHVYVRTSASATHRVDSSLAASGSTALYGDVTLSASGIAVITQTGQNISVYVPAAAASGSAVNSIAASGSTPLTGAVTLSASGGIVLTQTGQNIQIYAPTGGGSGGTGVNISSNILQTSHGFSVKEVLYYNGTQYSRACASADSLAEVLGMVTVVIDANNFTITNAGYINTFTGLSAGSTYYLSAATAGAIDVNAPSTVGYISKPVFVATAASAGYALESRGVVITPAAVAIPNSEISYSNANGVGSTNGAVLKWATLQNLVGSDLSFTSTAANGAYIGVGATGIYAISFTYGDSSTSTTFAIAVDTTGSALSNGGTTLNGNPRLLDYTDGIRSKADAAIGSSFESISWTGHLSAGAKIYFLNNSVAAGSTTCQFTVARIA